jgi:high-affinity Fe2+/Pb2+ permease
MDPSRFDQWWTLILQSIVMGAAFVWAGSQVAPAHNGRVAMVLAGIAIFVLGGVGVLFLETQQWWNLFHVLISACAAAFTGYSLHKEHE